MPVETKAGEKNMIQSPVVTCLLAYVALWCPFYLFPMGALRCKVLDQNKKKKIEKNNKKTPQPCTANKRT